MSVQFLAVTTLASAAAFWFLRGVILEFKVQEDCSAGCGACASKCPFQARTQDGVGPGGS